MQTIKNVFHRSGLPKLDVASPLFDVRFIHADNITVAFNELKAGAEVPLHHHVHETIDYVQEGTLQMTIGDETVEMNAGSVARVASNVPHSAVALSDCTVINVFYPVREDFRAEEAQALSVR